METLEAVVGDHNSLDGILEAAQADAEVIFKYFLYYQFLTAIAYSPVMFVIKLCSGLMLSR